MSEEEIIKQVDFITKWISEIGLIKEREALQGLLDLYNKEKLNSFILSEQLDKEKEKNKILDNMLLVNKEQYEFIKNKDKYISEDKIKAMIDKINKDYDDSVDEEGNRTCYYPDYTIDKLQELLEERN